MNERDDAQLLVDGELTSEQRARLLERLSTDPALAREVCALRNLKAQVQLAYEAPPSPPARRSHRRNPSWVALVAGIALLVFGTLLGWIAHPVGEGQRLVVLDPTGRGQALAQAEQQETRIVVHVTNPDMVVAGELLDEIANLLASHREQGVPLRVEVVSNGEGLALLRAGLSTHQARIAALARDYPNLTFVACQNTIDRLRLERGIEVRLVPEAEVTRSGVNRVVRRQREGWHYLKV